MFISKKRAGRRIVADEEIGMGEAGEVFVEPEATDLLFETEDVADILAEATGEDVTVENNPEVEGVTFNVGDTQYEVTPEGDEEILESRKIAGRRRVAASRRRVAASRKPAVRASRTAARRLGRRSLGR